MEENNKIEEEQIEELEILDSEESPKPPVENVEPVQPEPAPQVPQEMINQMNNEPTPQIIAAYDQENFNMPNIPKEQTAEAPTENVVEPPKENIQETPVPNTEVPPVVNNPENGVTETETTQPEPTPQQPFSMTPDPNVKIEEDLGEEKKKKSPKALIIGVVVLALLGGLYFLYNSIFQNKKVIVQKEVTTVFDSFIKTVKELEKQTIDVDFDKDKLGVEGSLSVSSNFKSPEIDLSKLKDYSFKYNGVIDKSNNKLSGSISLNKKDSPLLSLNAFLNGKTVLFQSEQIYNKILKTTVDQELKDYDFNSIDTKNITILLEKTRDIIKNSVNEKNIKKSSVSKEINGKKQSVNKVSYTLDLNQLEKDLINGYLKDSEVLDILSDMSGIEVKELKEQLNESLKYFGDDKNEILIESYHDKLTSALKLIEVIQEEKGFDGSNYSTVFSITKDKDIDKFSLKTADTEIFTGFYDKKKEEFKIETSIPETRFELVLKKNKENSYSLNMNMAMDEIRFSVESTFENKVSKDSVENNAKVSINVDVEGEKINADITSA